MGSPTIFNGKFTKLLTPSGLIKQNGSVIQNDGFINLINNSSFENGLVTGWEDVSLNLDPITGFATGVISSGGTATLSIESTSPIRGAHSLKFTNSGVNGIGFWSDPFVIDEFINSSVNYSKFLGGVIKILTGSTSNIRYGIYNVTTNNIYSTPDFPAVPVSSLADNYVSDYFNDFWPVSLGDSIRVVVYQGAPSAITITPYELVIDDLFFGVLNQAGLGFTMQGKIGPKGGFVDQGNLIVNGPIDPTYNIGPLRTTMLSGYFAGLEINTATWDSSPGIPTYDITMKTGDWIGTAIPGFPLGGTGIVTITSGDLTATGMQALQTTGEVIITTGDATSTDCVTGNVTISTGEISSSSGLSSPKTGDINIFTGTDQTGNETTGSVFINTGSGTGGTSATGSIFVETGFSSTARGTVSISGFKNYIESNANSVDEINETKIIIGKDGNLNKARPFEFITSTGTFTLGPSDTSNYSIIFPDNFPDPLSILQYDDDTNKMVWVPYMPSLSDIGTKYSYGSTTIDAYGGVTSATSGTVTSNAYNNATWLGRFPTLNFSTTATAGTTTGCRISSNPPAVGRGLYFETTFKITDAATVPLGRHFCGFNNETTGSSYNGTTNSNPILNALNTFGMAFDGYAGDTNFYIYHNDGSGTATKINLGAAFTSVADKTYKVVFYSPKGQLAMYYNISELNSSGVVINTASGVATSNLPAVSLYTHNERFNGGSNLVTRFTGSALKLFVE